eukprot:539216-Pyramimonas_sp.AAC.1
MEGRHAGADIGALGAAPCGATKHVRACRDLGRLLRWLLGVLARVHVLHRRGEAPARTPGAPHVNRPGRRHMGGRPRLATA